MKKLTLALVFALASIPAAAQAPKSFADLTRSLSAQPGFMETWRDADHGRVLLAVSMLDQPFLLLSSLPAGLGTNDVGLDRGQLNETRLVHFEKRGGRLFLVQENARFVANSANRDERQSVTEAFASSVLWSGDILASEGGKHLVDFSSFLLTDWQGVSQRLADTKQGSYRIDDKRSAVLAEQSKSFPDNTELEAMLTFAGPGQGNFVREVAPDPASLTMRQHISLVRLPDAGFKPRAYHPASGGIDVSFYDFAKPLADSIDVHYQVRFRLDKPLVFYIDRGAPEPVRSALMDGVRWWASAFDKAGLNGKFRVELLPEGVDPMDVRYNVVQWVHRSTRGWSFGSPIVDPRTGEIIHGGVTLDSQRVRQDIMIFESLLAPYGKDGSAKQKQAEDMALARVRQLAAHEVGHALGFQHNFAASRFGNGSVLDYPHPSIKLDAQGKIDLADAYGVGVGPWDDYIIKHAYGVFENESESLARLRADMRATGMQYVSEPDARANGSVHPNGLLWDFGTDTLKAWDHMMAMRERALKNFSFAVLPPARQAGEIQARLVPVYLMHRYQLEAVARLLGGASYSYTTAGDVQAGAAAAGMQPVDAATQRAALDKLVATLRAESLALPDNVTAIMTPAAMGYEHTNEYFGSRMNTQFDAFSVTEAGAAQTVLFLLDAQRMNRLAQQQMRDPKQPGPSDVVAQVLQSTWKRGAVPHEQVQAAANWIVLEAMLRLLDGGVLHQHVDMALRDQLREFAQWLETNAGKNAQRRQAADRIRRYLADPASIKLRPLPAIPPGAPI